MSLQMLDRASSPINMHVAFMQVLFLLGGLLS
jgi:hypothetical protein